MRSRVQPKINLDRALRYAAAEVILDGSPTYSECFVVSGENPRLKVSRSGKYQPNFDGLLQYAYDNKLKYSLAEGRDAVAGNVQERSLAFPSISLEHALSIAREFGQEAVFHLSPGRQDVVFLGGGRIECTSNELSRRQAHLRRNLSQLLSEMFRQELALPRRVRDLVGWHYVGIPDHFEDIGNSESQRHIYRTLDDGRSSYRALAVLVNIESGEVRSFPVRNRRAKEDGSDAALVSSRIHLNNCAFSDRVEGLTESRRWYYVYKSDVPYDKKRPLVTSVYVGETGLPPDERIQRHRAGNRGSKWVRSYPGALDRSLMPEVVLPNETTSKAFEEWYACLLRQRPGFVVRGGR